MKKLLITFAVLALPAMCQGQSLNEQSTERSSDEPQPGIWEATEGRLIAAETKLVKAEGKLMSAMNSDVDFSMAQPQLLAAIKFMVNEDEALVNWATNLISHSEPAARAELTNAKIKLIEAEIKSKKECIEESADKTDRFKSLHSEGVVSRREMDISKNNLLDQTNQLTSAQEKLVTAIHHLALKNKQGASVLPE